MDVKNIGIIVGTFIVLAWLWPKSGPHYKFERLFWEAVNLRISGEYREAITRFEEALEEGKKHVDKTNRIDEDFSTLVKYNIAACYLKLADQEDSSFYMEAEKILKAAYGIATVPKHKGVITYLWGYALFKQERYAEALPKFEELIQSFPQSLFVENTWYALGKIHFKMERKEEGRRAFQQLLENFPNSEYKEEVQQLLNQSSQTDGQK